MTPASDVVRAHAQDHRAHDAGVDVELEAALLRLLEATDREDSVAFVDELAVTEERFLAAGTTRWTAWAKALSARRRLFERDPDGAGAEVTAARAVLDTCPASAETALTMAYLSHVEIAADRFDAGMHLAVDASLIADSVPSAEPDRALHQAHHWLSLALTRLDLEELAVAHALRGHRIALSRPELGDRWSLLRLCAQQHTELAQTVARRGEGTRAVELAEVALRCVASAGELDWEACDAERDQMDVVHAWAMMLTGDTDPAVQRLRATRRRVQADGGLWLLGYTDLVLARLLARQAQSCGDVAGPVPDAAREATDLLVSASGAFAAVGDRRRYRQCLLELGQGTALMGDTVEALHWLEAYRADTVRAHLRGRELWAEMFVRRSRLREAERQADLLRRHALEDPLTSLGNRRSAERRLAELHLADGPVSLAIVDVDRFKDVNDQNSHLHGDAVLRRVADLLRQHCRTGDEVYRWAGDEFLVVLPSATESQAAGAMERLRSAVATADWSELQLSCSISVSIGVATAAPGLTPGAHSWRALFDSADLHLFSAKRSGRNLVRAATPGAPLVRHPGQQGTRDGGPLTVDEMVADVLGTASGRRPSGWAFVEDDATEDGVPTPRAEPAPPEGPA
ncbi:diguanylate cyclase [Modestobacter sp. I12A-02628]|uniref:GGDEF domain-containing protein n=1 Tax=Goekera deserti TaxID=2497753 RepID=A0A7K3WK35_9ACTN|nr:GGDEF domain-containing protein [Goekera deserti]MPQ97823.1 diguanylate cyclase [Goekera deserti]NDI48468.1 diguanylate cyclase [Goekera deserti]NEL56070.1 GGDEF domain-containing protein [Goekera deserti]